MFFYNYHTHTKRCGHAIGEDEDYVLSAIKFGYQKIGFSDHIILDDKESENYIESIKRLQKKYQDQIQIFVAYECEYVENRLSLYHHLLETKKVDYLIFGNHYTIKDDKKIDFCLPFNDLTKLEIYYDTLKKALDSHLFKYICHPDCFLKGYQKWDEHAISLTHKIAKLLCQYDCYVELSASGYRSHSYFTYQNQMVPPYPFKEFFKILRQYPIKFVLGADAHAPEQLYDEGTQFIENMATELDLNITPILKL